MRSVSPLRFPGGKTRAIKKIINYLPKDVTTICSPFLGGGSCEIYCLRNRGVSISAYDLFEPIVTFWNCLMEDAERLATVVSRYRPVVSKDQFYRLQKTFLQIEDRWERAAATYVLNRTSFSGSIAAGGFSPLDESGKNGRFKESNVEFLKHFRFPEGKLTVERAPFEESILRHPEAFAFCDPPYMVESKLYGRRGDLHHINHLSLADILRSRDNWMLCYDDCPEVRRLYNGFHLIDERDGLSWQYGMGNLKKSREVLILSHDVAEQLGLKASKNMSAGRGRVIETVVPLIR